MRISSVKVYIRFRGYETFFMHNSTEHEISTAHKTKIQTNKECLALSLSDVVLYHANTFMPRINFMFS